ncbi:hypothetical protein HanXRQr2_Chr09g0413291 [Helianthus annuus]|uniref:Uncharacterized protein n=1 Tax=Helianthus annuus TaxID=4232 RepID=A0A9K3NAH8_HELAN|nr:hypothetical protein HanXRQr2_Chr09g0413291 [Helianthus annuus]
MIYISLYHVHPLFGGTILVPNILQSIQCFINVRNTLRLNCILFAIWNCLKLYVFVMCPRLFRFQIY